jgi:hypothetical protein
VWNDSTALLLESILQKVNDLKLSVEVEESDLSVLEVRTENEEVTINLNSDFR